MTTALWRVQHEDRAWVARGDTRTGPAEIVDLDISLTAALSEDSLLRSVLETDRIHPLPAGLQVLAPIDGQEVWASGVTFERSRSARLDEAATLPAQEMYDRVFVAERPELFFKATASRVRGPGDMICIREDSEWNVPEPELGLVIDRTGRIVGYTIGNDVSSRSIEGANPLYLPQAKVYEGSCAIGPCIVPAAHMPDWRELSVELVVERGNQRPVSVTEPLSRLRRTPEELASWLLRAMSFPRGCILLTGTGIVPEVDFTLLPDDVVTIRIDGIGTLQNRVALLRDGSLSLSTS